MPPFRSLFLVLSLTFSAKAIQFQPPSVATVINKITSDYAGFIYNNGSEYIVGGSQARDLHHADTYAEVEQRQSGTPYWYESITKRGVAPFTGSGYQVYRNVKDYGARGDGVTDDTAAINAAISVGGRCGKGCASTSTTPAVVYFPAGTYLLSSSIIDYYFTQLIGNPNNPPVLKATANFQGFGLIDGDPYFTANLNWGSTNVFLRQVRNFVFDLTGVPASNNVAGIHWPTSQATSLQNLVFNLTPNSQHVGIFSESGSAGFMTDLTFNGGNFGAQIGNQQFTMRNLVFNGCTTAISQFWDWGWVYQGISINNCQKGIDISAGGPTAQSVGSMIILDSSFTNTPVAVLDAYTSTSSPPTAGSLILENVSINNVGVVVSSQGNTVLGGSGGQSTIAAWGQGHKYVPNGPQQFQGSIAPVSRPSILAPGGKYYTRSKPQYNSLPVSSFVSARAGGAAGDGNTDDTAALQRVINSATAAGNVVFVDAGTYMLTSTLTIPPGAKIVGEGYSVFMSTGSFFNDPGNPQPVVRVGAACATGRVEWSDMLVSTRGQQRGAILIEWNLASDPANPSGIWDVHTRIGGTVGSNLQYAQCPSSSGVNQNCVAAYMSMHITKSAGGLYMENVWLWTADHDVDDQGLKQVSVYNGRGLLIESAVGGIWLVGTAVEHHVLYQYQFSSTTNIYAGFIQTETPYYQPNPPAPAPFTVNTALHDPDFATSCQGKSGNCAGAWGLRVLGSTAVSVYGAGLYSFFSDYSTACSNNPGPENCQNSILSIEASSGVNVYTLATIGSTSMVDVDGVSRAVYSDNQGAFPQVVAWFRS